MTAEDKGFHARDNWYFRREDDGSVRIMAPDSMGPGAHQVGVFDPDTWASAVASVSSCGETAESFQAARRFHDSASTDGA